MTATKLLALGAFVIGGVLLFTFGLFMIGNRRMLFTDTFYVHAEFAQIAGVENGAIVRVAGMAAGEVDQITVPTTPSGRFRLKLRIREDLHALIRTDSVASIQTDGLVGNKYVQVDTGTDAAPVAGDEGTIKSREPFNLADMLQRMSETLDLVTASIVDVKGGVEEALTAITATVGDAQQLIGDLGADARSITGSAKRISEDFSMIVAGVRQGRGTVGKLVTDDALYQNARAIVADAERTVANLREASEQAKAAVAGLRGENGPVKGVAGDLQQTLASARDAMADLADATEALKRNFFFRGFFNRRGYFDLQDVSVQQYREGALETDERRALRIWAAAEVLFEKDARGVERLTDDGRARLDSAMAEFVRHPRSSPFVVEGYAGAGTADARFLLSRSRAETVRDYLVGKYGLDPNAVAIMPMGSDAQGSPAGDRWEGVALAMFVPRVSG